MPGMDSTTVATTRRTDRSAAANTVTVCWRAVFDDCAHSAARSPACAVLTEKTQSNIGSLPFSLRILGNSSLIRSTVAADECGNRGDSTHPVGYDPEKSTKGMRTAPAAIAAQAA